MQLNIRVARTRRGNGGRKFERRDESLRGSVDGTSSGRTPAALRVHDYVPLHLPAVDDGAGTAARLPEDQSAADRRRTLQPRGAILGEDLWDQFCPRRRYRHPDGVSVRDKLGRVLESRGRSDRADASDGGRVLLFSRIEFPGIIFVW